MPNSSHNAASAAPKRPGLGRRAISSHAVITRANSSGSGDLSDPSSSTHSHKPHHVSRHHHHPRPHLVGHRHHHVRNPSHGKNANKLQRLASGLPETGKSQGRKKSAPTTPAASPPRGSGHHVRWEGETDEPEAHLNESVKKNYSSPALRRTHFTNGGSKKTFASERPPSSSGKKTVGFELGDSENDDGEWEDTTQSPESTRRSSVVQSRDSADNAAALVDPLIFVKRPVPHMPRASSLPEPRSAKNFSEEGRLKDEDDDNQDNDNNRNDNTDNTDNIEEAKQNVQGSQEKEQEQQPQLEQQQEQGQGQEKAQEERPQELHEQENEPAHAPESSAIASRLLSPSLSAKAPPAMSSISALAKPAASDVHIPPNTSLNSLSSGQDGPRRAVSSSTQLANTPGNQTQATSSSIEGGVSRFIVDNGRAANQPSYKTDSDPNTPSFLPHYHPNTPPSPKGTTSSQKPKASPPSRPPGAEPPSRTQQKLWLQRTAALNTSPPDSHGSGTGSPSTMDPAYMATARPGSSPYDTRGLANGAVRAGGSGHDSEAKQTRKAYEKTALELDVVRRFQSPTADSFNRLRSFIHETQAHERRASLAKSVQSAPSLPALRDGQQRSNSSQADTANDSRQLAGRQMPESSSTQSVSQGYTQDADDSSVNASDGDHGSAQKSPHPSHRILSSSDDTAHGNSSAEEDKTEYVNEAEMMVRRLWDTRIVASSA